MKVIVIFTTSILLFSLTIATSNIQASDKVTSPTHQITTQHFEVLLISPSSLMNPHIVVYIRTVRLRAP